jgi:hypothetical protein
MMTVSFYVQGREILRDQQVRPAGWERSWSGQQHLCLCWITMSLERESFGWRGIERKKNKIRKSSSSASSLRLGDMLGDLFRSRYTHLMLKADLTMSVLTLSTTSGQDIWYLTIYTFFSSRSLEVSQYQHSTSPPSTNEWNRGANLTFFPPFFFLSLSLSSFFSKGVIFDEWSLFLKGKRKKLFSIVAYFIFFSGLFVTRKWEKEKKRNFPPSTCQCWSLLINRWLVRWGRVRENLEQVSCAVLHVTLPFSFVPCPVVVVGTERWPAPCWEHRTEEKKRLRKE